jgi:hypothetical protein
VQCFTIPRHLAGAPPHLGDPLPAVRVDGVQEILSALREALNFQLSNPVILLVGTAPPDDGEAGQAERLVISSMCDEVIGPLARRHYVTVLTNGSNAGLAAVIGKTREAQDFRLVGVKRAATGDGAGEGIDLAHSHLLTVAGVPSSEALTQARLATARALSREIGPNHYRTVAILMGGDEAIWDDLSAIVRAGVPLIVVEGSGGIADEIARVRTYLQEIHRPRVWSVDPPPEAPFPIETLDLRAAGFHFLYREPGMSVTVYDGTDDSGRLYSLLKGEFYIHSRE